MQKYTRQEVFDSLDKYILDFNKKAVDEHRDCVYQTEDGRRCAIGALCSDKQLEIIKDEGLNNEDVDDLIDLFSEYRELGKFNENDVDFYNTIQGMHDGNILYKSKESAINYVKNVAVKNRLDYTHLINTIEKSDQYESR